jgi:adenosylcobinamide-GDP ribazoletransferase
MLADLIHDCKVALAFLTRLPVRERPAWRDADLAASVPLFPVVGALIGVAGSIGYALAVWLGLPPWPAATIALATTIWLTGALHEDGLADFADGCGGGRTREDKLRIMRDPRVGSYGAIALILALLARAGALAALAAPWAVGAALVAAGAVSRAALPAVMASLPNARADGLAAGAGRPHPLRAAAAVVVAALIAIVLLGQAAPAAVLAGVAGALAVALLARRQIGGYTGDVLGAVQQLAEIGVLLGALAVRSL